ncbi:MAG TPA: response regulator [Clostridia bacterium]|nr:response regulator [Clostridia bacterium]
MEPNNVSILVVEDDRQIRNFIHYTLNAEGFRYISSGTGQGALSILVSEPVDLMLLDLGLPDCDGMEIIRKVREWSEMPIIVVSGRDQDKEKAAMLDLGADDYLTKPFSATELLARIRVALRHLSRQNSGGKEQIILQVGGLQIDPDKRLIYVDGQETHVTPMEYSLLTLLFRNMGKVLTTKHILNEIWGVGYGNDTQALRTLMAGLRRKIEKNPAKPRYILTEMGVGYRLTDE